MQSLPNITGKTLSSNDVGFRDEKTKEGAFYLDKTSEVTHYVSSSSSFKGYKLAFDASIVSSVYQNNAKVKPESYTCKYCIKY